MAKIPATERALNPIRPDEDKRYHQLALLEIGKLHLNEKPLRYVRQPSSKEYSMVKSVAQARGYLNINDLLDDLARYAFWLTFVKNQDIQESETK